MIPEILKDSRDTKITPEKSKEQIITPDKKVVKEAVAEAIPEPVIEPKPEIEPEASGPMPQVEILSPLDGVVIKDNVEVEIKASIDE